MRINICPPAMLCQLNISAQSKDHVPRLSGSLSQSHAGLFLVLEIMIKCSESPAWRVLGAKHYWDTLTFLKSLRDFPQTRRLSGQDFLLVWIGLKNLHCVTPMLCHWWSWDLHGHTTRERLCTPALTIFWALSKPWDFTGVLLPKYFWKWGFFLIVLQHFSCRKHLGKERADKKAPQRCGLVFFFFFTLLHIVWKRFKAKINFSEATRGSQTMAAAADSRGSFLFIMFIKTEGRTVAAPT